MGENLTWDQHLSATPLPYSQLANENSVEGIYLKCRLQGVGWARKGAEEH